MNFINNYWIMFLFGFLIDKINLFPFILGVLFGLYISNENINNIIVFSEIISEIKEYLKKIINLISVKNVNKKSNCTS